MDAGATPAVPGLVLDRHLGSGTFGAVWRGVDLGTGEPVAVRIGRPAGGAEAVAREGALLRRLRHENVVRLRSVVDLGDDVRALVVDLVPGGSLAALVERRGALPPGEVATVAVGVARALQHLHAHGFVHGRLTSRDVLFDAQGRPVATDVGVGALLAPVVAASAPPRYPSPADDVLALGELLRDALVGGAAGPLGDLVAACLAPDPAARPTPDRAAQLAQRAVPLLPVDLSASAPPAAPTTPGWRPLPGRPPAPATPVRPAAATHLARAVAAPPAPVRPPVPTVPAPATPPAPDADSSGVRRVAVVFAAVLAGAGLTAGALALALRTDGAAEPQQAAAPAGAPAAPSSASPSPSVLSDVASVVGRLAGARAAAFSSASEAALARVDAPGSAALEQDLAFVRRLRAAGVRLEGLRFAVGDVRVVAATGDGVTVEARVATSAYRQVRPDGTVALTVPAQPARQVQLTLVRVGGDWRVSAVV